MFFNSQSRRPSTDANRNRPLSIQIPPLMPGGNHPQYQYAGPMPQEEQFLPPDWKRQGIYGFLSSMVSQYVNPGVIQASGEMLLNHGLLPFAVVPYCPTNGEINPELFRPQLELIPEEIIMRDEIVNHILAHVGLPLIPNPATAQNVQMQQAMRGYQQAARTRDDWGAAQGRRSNHIPACFCGQQAVFYCRCSLLLYCSRECIFTFGRTHDIVCSPAYQ